MNKTFLKRQLPRRKLTIKSALEYLDQFPHDYYPPTLPGDVEFTLDELEIWDEALLRHRHPYDWKIFDRKNVSHYIEWITRSNK